MKSIEEKAREYAIGMAACHMTEDQALPDDQTINDFTMTFLAGYEEAARWIPVEERLPEGIGSVLVKFTVEDWGCDVICEANHDGSGFYGYYIEDLMEDGRDVRIIAWRPI